MKAPILVTAFVALMATTGGSANAEFGTGLINMDFNIDAPDYRQQGGALLGTAGDTWNVDSPQGINNTAHTTGVLLLANGNASNGVTVSLGDYDGAFQANGNIDFASTPYEKLMQDGYIENTGKTFTLVFNGLTALQTYNLYLYSYKDDTPVHTTIFTIDGAVQTVVNARTHGILMEGVNYAYFKSQSADAAGRLLISMQGSGGPGVGSSGGIINGFQISPMPEPATILTATIGLLTLCTQFARKQSSENKGPSFI